MLLDAQTIAVVEDDPIMGESLVQRLSLEGASVRWWQRGREAAAALAANSVQAVICDMRLPDLDGEAVFREVIRGRDAPPFLFITGYGDIDQAVRLMRVGAADYVTKPFDMDDFLNRLADLMRYRVEQSPPEIGISGPARALQHFLTRVAKTTSTVLITGETGTGKDVAARFLHARSAAAAKPFIAVNCAAIPADLLESELFGHERGAFTGAAQRHHGYAERAADGILFLDEIGELRLELQSKLLRVLENRTFFRVGGEQPVQFRARLVAASNADLAGLVASGRFRADLYYRINVVPIAVPPLRERKDDILWLMERFFTEFAPDADAMLRGISPLAEEAALDHPWPGNVRELRNRMERAVALSLGPWLMPGDLFPEWSAPLIPERIASLEDARCDAERRHIQRALAATGGEIAAAAKLLGVGRTTLWEKMKRLEIGAD